MAAICDRSPCDGLLTALGRYVFGVAVRGRGLFSLEVTLQDGRKESAMIVYCPFCGTRLDEIGPGLLELFLPDQQPPTSSRS